MSEPTVKMAVRLRLRSTLLTALGMALVIFMVGALFPAVGGTIGKLHLPRSVAQLLGGADYGTLVGWMKSEIGAVYGPLVIAAVAIMGAAGSTAGEEEDGILGLVLAHPIGRSRLILAKAGAVLVGVLTVALGVWLGLLGGVALAGGGIGMSDLAALAVHLGFFGFAIGTLALALAATTGRKAIAAGSAGAFTALGFLVNGFAPFVPGLTWLKYISPFYYYSGHDPLSNGVCLTDLAVLAAVSVALTAIAVVGLRRRDLRG